MPPVEIAAAVIQIKDFSRLDLLYLADGSAAYEIGKREHVLVVPHIVTDYHLSLVFLAGLNDPIAFPYAGGQGFVDYDMQFTAEGLARNVSMSMVWSSDYRPVCRMFGYRLRDGCKNRDGSA